MDDISDKVLLEDKNFTLGNRIDGLDIISYLQLDNFISYLQDNKLTKVSSEAKGDKRILFEYYLNKNGKVSIDYNYDSNTAEVIIRGDTPKYIAEILQKIGEQSKEK